MLSHHELERAYASTGTAASTTTREQRVLAKGGCDPTLSTTDSYLHWGTVSKWDNDLQHPPDFCQGSMRRQGVLQCLSDGVGQQDAHTTSQPCACTAQLVNC